MDTKKLMAINSKGLNYQQNAKNECHLCHKTFIKPCSLKHHFRSQHDFFPYSCNKCARLFSMKYDMEKHKLLDHYDLTISDCS